MRLAEWARGAGLDEQAEHELRAVLRLDADHAGARRALGYVRHDGTWVTREQRMRLLSVGRKQFRRRQR